MDPFVLSYSGTAEYKKCPTRRYFLYKRRWEPADPNIHLATGLAYHKAMTAVWLEGCSGPGRSMEAAVQAGIAAFDKEWEALGMPVGQELLTKAPEMRAKTPMTAHEVIRSYALTRWGWMGNVTLLGNEEMFELELGMMADGTPIRYRGIVDKRIEDEYGMHAVEHKTSSAFASKGGFRNDTIKTFAPNAQVEGYQWYLDHSYPEARIGSVYVDLSLFHKEHRAFLIVPCAPSPDAVASWADRQLEWSRRIISAERANAPVPIAFPRNEESCIDKFGPCKFYDICRFHNDPAELEDFPPGFGPRREMGEEV